MKRKPFISFVLAGTAMAACGSKKDDKNGNDVVVNNPVGIYKANGDNVEISLSEATAGDKYILLPYILGDDGMNGGRLDQAAGTFTVSAPGAKSLGLIRRGQLPTQGLRPQDIDHMRRSIWNRYDSRLGLNQGSEFWQMVDTLDQWNALNSESHALVDSQSEPSLRQQLTQRSLQLSVMDFAARPAALPLQDSACPPTILRPTGASPSTAEVPDADLERDDQGSFCMVYSKAYPPVTESDKTKLRNSVKTVLDRYKAVYADAFDKDHESYHFKPVVVFLPFHQASYWPAGANYQILGVFDHDLSVSTNQPILYMTTDVSKIPNTPKDVAAQRLTLHSTIAHEMQHAITDYFKVWKPVSSPDGEPDETKREILSYDEGMAHYFEDLMGYQEVSFSTYPGAFLAGVAMTDNDLPFFWDMGNDGKDYNMRGANQCFFYYLISRAGGVSFTDGAPAAGNGLNFIRAFIKTDGNALANLKAAAKSAGLGDDWVSLVGKYAAALMVDGSNTATDDPSAKTQGAVSGVSNTVGDTGKSYGFAFNKNTGDISTRFTEIKAANAPELGKQTLNYYHTRPIMYEVADAIQKITFNFPSAKPNTAVAVVKVVNGSKAKE